MLSDRRALIGVVLNLLAPFFCLACSGNTGNTATPAVPYGNTARFTVRNGGTQPIVRVVVLLSGQRAELTNILPSQRAETTFRIVQDDHYDVTVEFKSGRRLQKTVGYVTPGLNVHDTFVVTDGGVGFAGGREDGK